MRWLPGVSSWVPGSSLGERGSDTGGTHFWDYVRDPERSLGLRLAEHVRENFDLARAADAYREIYAKL